MFGNLQTFVDLHAVWFIHSYIYTYIQTYVYTYVRTYIHLCTVHACIHTYICRYMGLHILCQIHRCIMHIYKHTFSNSRIHNSHNADVDSDVLRMISCPHQINSYRAITFNSCNIFCLKLYGNCWSY